MTIEECQVETMNELSIDMQKDVNEAIQEIKEQIVVLQAQETLINSFDFSKPVDEDAWHQICETPLRSSNLLAQLVKNIFPLAENILVHCNYVYFDMMGFKVQIPTSRCKGINVDVSWYERDNGEPTIVYSEVIQNLIDYFDAVDNNKGWYECARNRLTYGKYCKKWILFIVWWFKYRWKDPRRKLFEEAKKKEEEDFKERVEKYHSKRKAIKNKAEILLNELLPLLDKFSTHHSNYNDQWCYTIEQIRKFENL